MVNASQSARMKLIAGLGRLADVVIASEHVSNWPSPPTFRRDHPGCAQGAARQRGRVFSTPPQRRQWIPATRGPCCELAAQQVRRRATARITAGLRAGALAALVGAGDCGLPVDTAYESQPPQRFRGHCYAPKETHLVNILADLALALFAVFSVVGFGWRSWLQHRRTVTGFRGVRSVAGVDYQDVLCGPDRDGGRCGAAADQR